MYLATSVPVVLYQPNQTRQIAQPDFSLTIINTQATLLAAPDEHQLRNKYNAEVKQTETSFKSPFTGTMVNISEPIPSSSN